MSTIDRDVALALERFEGRVWSDAVAAATPEVAAELGLSVVPIGGGVALVATRVPSLLYNRCFAFGLEAPIEDAEIERARALYPPGVSYTIQPAPLARPADVVARLRSRGLESYFDWVIWARGALAPLAAPPVRIEPAGAGDADLWVDLASEIFPDEAPIADWLRCLIGRPGWTHYLAYEEGRPVGIGAMFVEGELAWIGWGGTLAAHRRRGVQAAMIARRVGDAAALGARWVRSETADDFPEKPNASFRNMARCGFTLVWRRPSHFTPSCDAKALGP